MDASSRQADQWSRIALAGLGSIGLTLLYVWGRDANPGSVGFRLDDAWIHMVYGRSLAQEGMLAYNPGVPSTGATSPLWALILGGLHLLFSSPEAIVVASYGLLSIAHLTMVDVLYRAVRLSVSAPLALAVGLLCHLAWPLSSSVFSGMEVTATSLCLVWAAWSLMSRDAWQSGVALMLSCLLRPECAAVGLFAFAWWFATRRGRGSAAYDVVALALPSAIAGAALIGFDLWATGRPLPATFYLKESTSFSELPLRAWLAMQLVYGQIPSVGQGVLWFGAMGLLWKAQRVPGLGLWMGMGLSLALANLVVMPPNDPTAFYHVRYLLPALPLLIAAFVLAGSVMRVPVDRWGEVPVHALTLVAIALVVAGPRLARESRRFHSDIRNINELQRALGEYMHERVPEGAWIATNDAGAVRYFSERRTIDLMGLNTPALVWEGEEWRKARPVVALALMPAWFQPTTPLPMLHRVYTEPYTVTSAPAMATQVVLGCPYVEPAPVRLVGARAVELYCRRP